MRRVLFFLFTIFVFNPISVFSGIGTLSLDSTFASLSVELNTSAPYDETDLVLEYQVDGVQDWTTGHPLAEISTTRFIGSILFLPQGTTYNVRVKTNGCADESCWNIGQISTRTAAFPSGPGPSYYVSKTGSDSNPGTQSLPFLTIGKAASVASAGSIIHINAGTYYEKIIANKSGTPDAYITYMGESGVYISGADETYDVIDYTDNWTFDEASSSYKLYLGYRTYFVSHSGTSRLFNYRQKSYTFENFSALSISGIDCGFWSSDDGWLYVHLPGGIDPDTVTMQIGKRDRGIVVSSANYLIFEYLDVGYFGTGSSTGAQAIELNRASNIVIRNCKIHHAYYGIAAWHTDSNNNLIENNEFYDSVNANAWPWTYNKEHDTETIAVSLFAGGGNVVRDNSIHETFNGIGVGSWGHLADENYNHNVDVYNNYIENAGDDCLEPEGANINTRIWNNTCKNIHMGISLAPITVGPIYIIRNKVMNYYHYTGGWPGHALKYANGGVYGGYGRIYLYHNTTYTLRDNTNALVTIGDIGNMVYRNNIFYGDRYGFENANSMNVPVDWDYDCIHTRNTGGIKYYIAAWWYPSTYIMATDIAAFRTATGQETHGTASDPLFTSIDNYDISLKDNSPCRDSGVVIIGINDTNYVGSAPDMGASEHGTVQLPAPPLNLKIVSVSTDPDPDTTAPIIDSVSSSNITSTDALVTWITNEASDSQVEYGTTTGYGNITSLNSAMVKSHSQTLNDLTPSILYHYRVYSKDAVGNAATSEDYTFITTALPDTTAPVISELSSSNITGTSALISWTTNEVSDSQVEYGTTTGYGNITSLNSAMVTSHSLMLRGLTKSTLYHFRVKSKDAGGNASSSGDYTFTTTDDVSYKVIDDWMRVSPTTDHKASTFSWEGSGSFDPYNRVWIHDAGHDAFSTVQAFALWTWDITNGGWKVRFPDNGPPGS